MEEATMMRDRLKTAPLNREHVAIGFRAIRQMKLKYCLFWTRTLEGIGLVTCRIVSCNRSSARADFTRRYECYPP
jgi:hypothetical protein